MNRWAIRFLPLLEQIFRKYKWPVGMSWRMDEISKDREVPIVVRQNKYLNNIIEQDRRAVKRITKRMMGFKSCYAVRHVLAGLELMHMVRKGQMIAAKGVQLSFANLFHALAA